MFTLKDFREATKNEPDETRLVVLHESEFIDISFGVGTAAGIEGPVIMIVPEPTY